MNKLPLSVSIISFNEEANIARCIEAVRDIATEIIVVDSHSQDRTVEIAESLGAKVFVEEWKGHIAQKNSAMSKCTAEWVLAVDCDEVVSEELKSSIIKAINAGDCDGYKLNRRTFFLGRWIDHAWYPDWNLRLIRRGAGIWQGIDPHDILVVPGRIGRLSGDLLHYSFKDLEDCLYRTVRYAVIESASYQRKGRRTKLVNLIINPLHGFIKHYIIKRGFLDGWQGFLLSIINAISIFMKYAMLWERQRSSDGLNR